MQTQNASDLRSAFFCLPDNRNPTKHYHANSQRIATRVDDALYYTLSDHLGSTTLVADANGDEVGYVYYDPYGAVLTNTLPATLSDKLLSHLDASTGLQYDGSRFYDPLVGGYVQPNPLLGPAALPLALHPYSATPLGPPGVAGIAGPGDCLTDPLCYQVANKSAGKGVGKVTKSILRGVGWHQFGVATTVNELHQLYRIMGVTYQGVFEELGDTFIREGEGLFHNTVPSRSWLRSLDFYGLNAQGYSQTVARRTGESIMIPRKIGPSFGTKLARSGLDMALPFAVDMGFQAYQDWNNPYLTPRSKVFRAGTSGGIGLIGGLAATRIVGVLLGTTTPPGWAVFFTSVVVGLFVESPVANYFNELLFPEEKLIFEPLE